MKKIFPCISFAAIFIISLFLTPQAHADLADSWTALTPGASTGIKFGANQASAIAYGNGTYVVLGGFGLASYSTDGVNWTVLTPGDSTGIKLGTSDIARGIAYVNDRFIALSGSGRASYSTDGVNWTVLPAGANSGIKFGSTTSYSVVYGAGKYVVVGGSGMASYSTDGVNWTILTAGSGTGIKFGTSDTANSIAYGNGTFVVVGMNGKASYSTDGISWTALTPGAGTGIKFGTSEGALAVTYANNEFVTVGGSTGKGSYSADGISWTSIADLKFSSVARGIIYGGKFVVVGSGGQASYTSDGPTPTPTPSPTPTPTTAPAGQSSSSSTSQSTTCTTPAPVGAPNLFQADVESKKATLYFAPVPNANEYIISYGFSKDDNKRYSVSTRVSNPTGVISYSINELSPNNTYYFVVRGKNDCMPGDWGNTMSVTTTKQGTARFFKSFVTQVLSLLPQKVTTASKSSKVLGKATSCKNYVVKSGDNLWDIAQDQLGNGSLYIQIMKTNGLPSSLIDVGQKLKLGC